MSNATDTELLARQLEEAQRRIELIRTVTVELNTISSLTNKLNNILKLLHDKFGINHSMVALPARHEKKLVIRASYGYGPRTYDDSIDLSTTIIGLAAIHKRPINITGLRLKKTFIRHISQGTAATGNNSPGLDDPESQIAIPLLANDELVAVLMAESYSVSVFSKDDENFLITLSQSIAVSIQNALLFDNMEEMIAERTAALQRSNQTKDQLFSIISHDLRGPVTSFHNISKLISHYNKQGEKEKVNTLFQRIDQSVGRLNHLLDNLLNWAMAHRNEIKCHVQKIDIPQLLREVTAVYDDLIVWKGLKVTMDADAEVFADGDYNTLSAVFRNVLSNALKYTPRDHAVHWQVRLAYPEVVITCADTGIGMAPERLCALFDTTGHRSTRGTENEKGTGLGLVVAREFVLLNKGRLHIDSSPGQGTTVTIHLPAGS